MFTIAFTDTNCCKTLTDILLSFSKMKGIIQEIRINPFGFILFADIQVIFLSKPIVLP